MLAITSNIHIPLAELKLSFARSGGPGGQNVNKVNSKVILRWRPRDSQSLSGPVLARFLSRYGTRLTAADELIISSQRHREQSLNIDDCLEKLRQMIVSVLAPPTVRRKTKPTVASKRRRTQTKQKHSAKKQQRRSPATEH